MPRDSGAGGRRRPLATAIAVAVLGGAGVLQWWAGEPPILAAVAAFVAIASLLTRWLPAVVALAAGFLLQIATYLAALVALGYFGADAPLRPAFALAVLLAPTAAVVPDLVLTLRPGRAADPARSAAPRWWLIGAACLGPVVLLAAIIIAGRFHAFGDIAWATSGDARNHLVIGRRVLAANGLDSGLLAEGPWLVNGVLGLFMDTHGRGLGTPGELLLGDLKALGQVSALLTVCWCLAASGLVASFGPLRGRGPAVAIGVASLLPLTGLGLGVAARDGFVSILLLAPLLCAALVVATWAARTRPERGSAIAAATAMAASLPVAAACWTPFFFVAGAAAIVPAVTLLWRASGASRVVIGVVLLLGGASGLAIVLTILSSDTAAKADVGGSIAPPAPIVSLLVPAAVVLLALGGATQVKRSAFVPYLVATAASLAITAYLVSIQPPGVPWNYYPSKQAWVWVLVGFPLLLVPLAHPPRSIDRRPRVERGALLAGGSLAVLLLAVASSTRNSPVLPGPIARLGLGNGDGQGGADVGPTVYDWAYPDAAALELAVGLGEADRTFVVWGIDPANDRMTNFWLATYDPVDAGTIGLWAYGATGAHVGGLCSLLAVSPDRAIATADPGLRQQVLDTCGLADVDVVRVDD